MDKTLTCNCGHEALAGDDDGARRRGPTPRWETHTARSHQEALLLVFRGEPTRLSTTARTATN